MKPNISRRGFLIGSGTLAASAVKGAATEKDRSESNPFQGTGGTPFQVGAPCLQAPGETTMGVSWSVSGLSKGEVEYVDNPDFTNARRAHGGSLGLAPLDVAALQVRLEGLKSATRYWYRTITTPFVDYKNCYVAKMGEPVVSAVHTFTTLGADASAHFCVMNDTHARWDAFELVVRKVKELKPTALVWNGDATNTTQSKQTAAEIFLNPPVDDRDYAADIPTFFEPGNHDYRGSWISRREEVVMPRHPAERRGDQWDLKWNFAVRMGDLALIGLDTGEDKPDGHPKWFGLANFTPYRRAQAKWLEEQFARPEIASAAFKVVFCHIPLFAAKGTDDYLHDGVKIDPQAYAKWSRECHDLWAPVFEKNGVQLVVVAHRHSFRFDRPTEMRSWAQVRGGGPELGFIRKWNGTEEVKVSRPERFPTVIEGKVENGRLRLLVHDVLSNKIVLDEIIS